MTRGQASGTHSGRPRWSATCGVGPTAAFSVDQSVYVPAGDRAGKERLVGYITRCPFSLSRLVKATAEMTRKAYQGHATKVRIGPQDAPPC